MNTGRFERYVLDGWRPILWIAAVVFLMYARTIFFGFTYLDDKELLVNNYSFISNLSHIPQAFTSRIFPHLPAPYYRPLLTVTLMVDSSIGGASAMAYHPTNILIHALASCMLFLLLARLGFNRLSSLFFSLFFAVHPALVQAVAWIPGRNDSLLAVFTLISFVAFLNYLDKRKRADYLLHLLFYALALFTKETAVMIAVICLLYARLIDKNGLPMRELKNFAAGWVVITAGWFIARQIALQNNSLDVTIDSLAGSFLVSSPAIIQYIGKAIFPFNLSVFPTIQDTAFIYGIAAAIIIFFALWFSKEKRWPFIVFGLSWFLLFLSPSLLRPSAAAVLDFQEHRMYLPMVGIIIMLHEIDAIKRMSVKRTTLLSCAIALCILAAINIRHTGNFANGVAYWENATATSSHSWLTHFRKASMYSDKGMLDKAEREYLEAVKLDPTASPVYAGLGDLYMAKDMPKEAELNFKKALATCPLNYPCYIRLGSIYYKQGRFAEAAVMWVAALKIVPDSTDLLKNMAILCAEQKDYKAALFYVERLRKLGVEPPAEFLKKIGAR